MQGEKGKLFVIAAPSGAGKTSLVREVMKRLPSLRFSISYTTRARRATEKDTYDYFFVDKPTFQAMIERGDFLEHAQVFDNFYGTSKSQVQSMLDAGDNVLLEIDWQGAQQIRGAMPQALSIFILPPSRAELERRLRDRKTDSDEVIARRLRDSIDDMSHWNEFDYVVVNDEFERAVTDLQAILAGRGEALQRDRSGLRTLIPTLLG
ncbi:MAG TPA: guanylate kinase [Povalibacter sp.]|uniref:guanylate kinase n=1 Tax=Povalibacter sp. TaxID=1962978 RepID=UPI002C648FA2|nr:guanylate kinase [Povalibacter sp.]HMN46295.1 guanylate kinase [Povalibacter sp.]